MKNESIMVNRGCLSNLWLLVCFALFATGVMPKEALSQYGGGSGTKDNPYKIKTAEQLAALSNNTGDYSKYFILDNNISMIGVSNEYVPIGNSTNMFQGSFNGNGKTITNFEVSRDNNSSPVSNFGLFGYVGTNGIIENLNIENGYVLMYNSGYISLLAARNYGIIRNCHVDGHVEGGYILGGLTAKNDATGNITNCSAAFIEIYGTSNAIGGLVGDNRGVISKCYAMTAAGRYIETRTNNVGGLVGYNGDNGDISNCYAIADTKAGTTQAGGLAGYTTPQSTISYCYSAGAQTFSTTTGIHLRGGIAAKNTGTIIGCIWNNATTDSEEGIGANEGTITDIFDYDTTGMQTKQNYLDAEWDFDSVWDISSGEYPILASLPDLTISYDEYHEDDLNAEIFIPIIIDNISSYGNGEAVNICIYTSTNEYADWDAIAANQTPVLVATTVPVGGESISKTISLGSKDTAGSYFYRMKINGDETLSESDKTNNWGPELEVVIYDAQFGEDDDSISRVLDQEPTFPRTASLYPAGDVDFVKLDITTISEISLKVSNDYATNIKVELYNENGQLASVTPNNVEDDELAELTVMLEPGVYYAKIFQPDNQIIMQYNVSLEKETLLPDVDVEITSEDTIYLDKDNPDYIRMDFKMSNNSQIPSGTYDYQLVTSNTDNIELSDPNTYSFVTGLTNEISLEADEESDSHFEFMPDSIEAGNMYYAVIVDSTNKLTESNESNNISTTVRVHTYQKDIFEDDNSLLNAKLLDHGSKYVHSIEPASDEDYMYIDLEQKSKITVEITSSDLIKLSLLRSNDITDPDATEILAFDTYTSNKNKYTWTALLDKDTYYLKVNEPGMDKEVPEYTISVKTVLHASDLVCSMSNKYLSVDSGTTGYQATVLLSNLGSAAASEVNASLKISSVKDTDWSTATELAENLDSIKSLIAYQNNVLGTFTFDIPENTGTYYLKAFVDSDGIVNEIDEDNNYSATIVLSVGSQYNFSGGNGSENSPWKISTAFDLDMVSEISSEFESFFKLTNDIDLNDLGDDYTSIGTSTKPFMGVFDGQGYTIFNYSIESDSKSTGIFAYTDKSSNVNSEIKDIKLSGVNILSESYEGPCGGLVGDNSCTILRCSVDGTINTDGTAGMLVGNNHENSMVLYSYADESTVNSSGNDCGMLIGSNAGVVMNCYAGLGVVSADSNVGGMVGTNSGSIYDSYSLATVMATGDNAGGMIGENSGVIGYCYSTGTLSVPTDNVYGGFCGLNSGSITGSFWSIADSDTEYDMSSGIGVTGLTAEEMLDKSIYETAGWLFGDMPYSSWLMADGHILPKLKVLYKFSGGEGTQESPYLLTNYVDLLLAGDLLSLHYKLNADINLADKEFHKPLFGNYIEDRPFTGTFDGGGHIISNFNLSRGRSYVGLFGYIEDKDSEDEYIAGISNLAVYNSGIETDISSDVTGTLVGMLSKGRIENCAVRDTYIVGSAFVGGLAGTASRSSISNCCFEGEVDAIEYAGGLVGGLQYSTVSNCYSNAAILAIDTYDGLAGFSRSTIIEKCYYSDNPYDNDWPGNLSTDAQFWYSGETGWDMTGETANGSDDLWKVIDGYGYPWLNYETAMIEGDFDKNESVDIFDFGILSENWLENMNLTDLQSISTTWLLKIYMP